MRKLFFLFLALVATTTLWAYDFKSGDLYYNITSSSAPYTVEVSDAGPRITTATIPETVTYNGTTYSVTSIGRGAFYDCSSLTSITIPNSVTSIGYEAFRCCSSLTSITISNSVTSIGDYAFSGCSSLTSVTMGNSVTSIGSYAFSSCSSLTSVTIPNSVTSIGGWAFSGCTSLTSVNIPNSVTSIGKSAFANCSSLTTPVYNAHCFAYLPTLFKGGYVIPKGIKQIAGGAFHSCSSLTSVTIPNSVTSIGDAAFAYCSSLTSITIPNSVTTIGDYTFYNCSSLTSITIPNSVTSIGYDAFRYCSSLASITCEAETPPTIGYACTFCDVSTSIPVYVPCGCVEAYKAASGWSDFTNIQEPLAEYSIEVYVNDTIMGTAKVNYNTFCDGAKVSATANDYYHFVQWSDGNTDNPRTLTLTQDTVLTAEFALTIAGQCGDNLYWSYDETAKTISITGSGEMYDYTASTQPWLLFKEEIKEVIIANTATSIGTSAFEGCIRLGKVSIGTAMVNIGANAFAGCTRLYHIYCYPNISSIC